MIAGGVTAHRAVRQSDRPEVVVDASARVTCGVAAHSTVRQNDRATTGVVDTAAAKTITHAVAADRAVRQSKSTVIDDASPGAAVVVAADSGARDNQRARARVVETAAGVTTHLTVGQSKDTSIEDATPFVSREGKATYFAIRHRQAKNIDRTALDGEDAKVGRPAGNAALNSQLARPRSVDRYVRGNIRQRTRQVDRAGDCKADRI